MGRRKRDYSRYTPEVAEKMKKVHEALDEFNRLIYTCPCERCGAQPGEACKSKPKTRTAPIKLDSPQPHMARVHAAHAINKRRKEQECQNQV